MPVIPDPYGYASVVTREPAACARPTRPSTRSTCRCEVLFTWQ